MKLEIFGSISKSLEPTDFHEYVTSAHWRKRSNFSEYLQANWVSICRRIKLNQYLSPLTRINLK